MVVECHAIGTDLICAESKAPARFLHPYDPFNRRQGCPGLAAGAAAALAPPRRAHPGHRCQSLFSTDFCAAVLLLCDRVSCYVRYGPALKNMGPQREETIAVCRTIGADLFCLEPKVAERVLHPHDPFHRLHRCRRLAAGAGAATAHAPSRPAHPAHSTAVCIRFADLCAALYVLSDPISCCM